LSIDLASAVRKRKPAKRKARLLPRPQHELVALTALEAGPTALMLDTHVYINIAAGRAGEAVRDAVDRAILFHCSVALAELATGVANADPSRPKWSQMRDHYVALFAAIQGSRLLTPDPDTWVDAGIQSHQRKESLNDTLILLTAAKAGLAVLTANCGDFDLIQQIAPESRFIYY
jgi:predicted nucleic acid-binding protein